MCRCLKHPVSNIKRLVEHRILLGYKQSTLAIQKNINITQSPFKHFKSVNADFILHGHDGFDL
jgi:hypothetical protein